MKQSHIIFTGLFIGIAAGIACDDIAVAILVLLAVQNGFYALEEILKQNRP